MYELNFGMEKNNLKHNTELDSDARPYKTVDKILDLHAKKYHN